jgi:hypothetical protein
VAAGQSILAAVAALAFPGIFPSFGLANPVVFWLIGPFVDALNAYRERVVLLEVEFVLLLDFEVEVLDALDDELIIDLPVHTFGQSLHEVLVDHLGGLQLDELEFGEVVLDEFVIVSAQLFEMQTHCLPMRAVLVLNQFVHHAQRHVRQNVLVHALLPVLLFQLVVEVGAVAGHLLSHLGQHGLAVTGVLLEVVLAHSQ